MKDPSVLIGVPAGQLSSVIHKRQLKQNEEKKMQERITAATKAKEVS